MGLHPKHPYEKPTITFIPVGTSRYEELMQEFSQVQKHEGSTTQSAVSSDIKEDDDVQTVYS